MISYVAYVCLYTSIFSAQLMHLAEFKGSHIFIVVVADEVTVVVVIIVSGIVC